MFADIPLVIIESGTMCKGMDGDESRRTGRKKKIEREDAEWWISQFGEFHWVESGTE